MKNKKSNIPAFVSTIGLAYLLLLAGCSQDDVQTPDDGTKDGNAIPLYLHHHRLHGQ